jgi:hypothetical protein
VDPLHAVCSVLTTPARCASAARVEDGIVVPALLCRMLYLLLWRFASIEIHYS